MSPKIDLPIKKQHRKQGMVWFRGANCLKIILALLAKVVVIQMQLFKIYVKNLSFQGSLAGNLGFLFMIFSLQKDLQDFHQIRFTILMC